MWLVMFGSGAKTYINQIGIRGLFHFAEVLQAFLKFRRVVTNLVLSHSKQIPIEFCVEVVGEVSRQLTIDVQIAAGISMTHSSSTKVFDCVHCQVDLTNAIKYLEKLDELIEVVDLQIRDNQEVCNRLKRKSDRLSEYLDHRLR